MVPCESRERKARCIVGPAAKLWLSPQAQRAEEAAPPSKQNERFGRAGKHTDELKNAIRQTEPESERKKAYPDDKVIDCRLKRTPPAPNSRRA